MPAPPATCLFDLGNVLVRFSHERMCEQLAQVSGLDVPAVHELVLKGGLQRDFETGRLTEREFHARFQEAAGRPVDFDDLRRAGAEIFWPNPGAADVLRSLKQQGVRLVLLSNTCVTHVDVVRRDFDVLEHFDALVLSCEVGAVKPDHAMYAAALEAIGCNPADCFYTDDVADNVTAGRNAGLDAELFTTVDDLQNQLGRRGIRV